MAEKQYVTFKLGEDLFGIDILLIREINRNLEITRVDRAPNYIRGMLNLRGQIVTVIDLRVRLGLEPREQDRGSSCVIVKTIAELERATNSDEYLNAVSTDTLGLFVDQIGDVVSVDSSDIEPPSANSSDVGTRFLEGIIKLDGCLLATLKISEILAVEDKVVSFNN